MKLSEEIVDLVTDNINSERPELLTAINDRLYDLEYESISAFTVVVDEESKTVMVGFTDNESDLLVYFYIDEEEGAVASIAGDEDSDEEYIVNLDDLSPPIENGMINFFADLTWLDEDTLDAIFSDEVSERQINVVRQGKRVKRNIIRKRRKKRLDAKRKASIRKALRKRKITQRQANRKRKRSLVIRKRLKLKNKPKKMRVVS